MSAMKKRVSAAVGNGWSPLKRVVFALGIAAGVAGTSAHARAQSGFGNGATITIPAGAPGTSSGVAVPYPSPITVTGLKRPIAHVIVSLFGYSHTCSADVGALLVGPQGQTCLLFGRCGSCDPGANNIFLSFDDNALAVFPPNDGTVPTTGFYRPGANCALGAGSFSGPAPSAPYGTALNTFRGTDGNGVWRLFIQDFAVADVGNVSGGWAIYITEAGSPVVTATGNGISIPAGQPGSTVGIAGPYPSNIVFSGISGKVSSVSVRINSLTHTFLRDIDMLLVGPNGQSCMLMSDVGGANPGVTQATLAFTDLAPTFLQDGVIPTSGTYRPSDLDVGESLPFPAPVAPYGTTLSVFNGANPNGFWSLYIRDDAGGDSGLTSLWDLTLHIEEPCPADFNSSGLLDVGDIFAFLGAWFGGCP